MDTALKQLDHTQGVLNDIAAERLRQNEKWGRQHHRAAFWMSILMEEVGEASKEINDCYDFDYNDPDIQDIVDAFRTEVLQCAAVAAAIVEDIDRTRAEAKRD